jgi:hypothetical protein
MLIEWRNGNLRRKFDAVKYTVKKLEQVIAASRAELPVRAVYCTRRPPAADRSSTS